MRIAILNTQTDPSEFAKRHDNDGLKFAALLRSVRPDWRYDVYAVMADEFPASLAAIDGIVITGSIASVHDDQPWIARLEELVREAFAAGIPQFGACFGHQVIATALGGTVGKNPFGWSFGVSEISVREPTSWMAEPQPTTRLFSAHIEQVTELPPGARAFATAQDVPNAGYKIDNRVATTQYHPEIDQPFFAELIEAFADDFPEDVVKLARAQCSLPTNSAVYAEWMARFFEQGARPGN